MKWVTRRSVHIVFAALVLLIAALGSLFYFQINRAKETGDLVIDSYQVMQRIEVLFRQIKDAEGHVYNYVITGDPLDHDHYQAIMAHSGHTEQEADYNASIDENLQHLDTIAIEDSNQQRLIDQLKPLLQNEKDFLNHVVALREKQGFDATLAFIKNNDDETVMTHMEQILTAFQAEENRLLEQRIAEDNRSDSHNKNMVLGAFLIALLMMAITYLLILRNLTQRLKMEAKDIAEQKRMERLKNEFVSTVSHELRTPLTSIRGALGLIAGGAVGELPPKVRELVNIAHKNSERLVRIVNDILDAEKIESGKVQLLMQEVDLSALARQAIEANQAYAEKHRVKLVLGNAPEGATLMADPDRLMQVMANLLSNAAKFSPEGSEVLIRVDRLENNLRISVEDHGPGIPEAFRSRIFEKFAQADGSSARGHEGTGLGLSITRKLAEAMGGTVGFTTETGKGSIFYVDLPALAQEEAPVETTAAEPPKNRVLIVEDNRDNATLIKILLEQAGFGVDIAYTLAQARQKLQTQSYAAMTLDLTLPDGDGVTLIREVRLAPATHTLPIVVVSGTAEERKGALSGEAVGLIDWLIKPIDEMQLVRALRHAVSHDGEGLPRILHVEDDPDLSLILREMLKDQAEIVTATTLKKARALLNSQNFALIVLDLSLPDGAGIELLTYMNTLAVKSTPVLILSASEASADIRARVAGVLVKSRTSENKIVDTILSLIHKASASKAAA